MREETHTIRLSMPRPVLRPSYDAMPSLYTDTGVSASREWSRWTTALVSASQRACSGCALQPMRLGPSVLEPPGIVHSIGKLAEIINTDIIKDV